MLDAVSNGVNPGGMVCVSRQGAIGRIVRVREKVDVPFCRPLLRERAVGFCSC